MTADVETELKDLYGQYTDSLKPLIAFVETKVLEFPGPILNELRAMNDHVSRCFIGISSDECLKEIGKAKGHLVRAMLDCYKLLLVSYEDEVHDFYKQYRDISLGVVNDGRFYPELQRLHNLAREKAKYAKIFESKSFPEKEKAADAYKEAIMAYVDIQDYVKGNTRGLANASQYARKQTMRQLWYCVVSAVLGGIVTLLIENWHDIATWITRIFT